MPARRFATGPDAALTVRVEVDEAEALFTWNPLEDAADEARDPGPADHRRRRGMRMLVVGCVVGALAATAIGIVAMAYLFGRVDKPAVADVVRASYERMYARCVATGQPADACEGTTENACLDDRRLPDDLNTLSSVCYSFKLTADRPSR